MSPHKEAQILTILGIAGLLFYFLMAPFWLGLRGLAWIAEFRARRTQ